MKKNRLRFNLSLIILFAINCQLSLAQEINYPQSIIFKLASTNLKGRGYVKQGDKKAAKYIKSELKKNGVQPFGPSYFQEFTFPINTFPGKMEISLNNSLLNPVIDYVVAPDNKGLQGTFPLLYLPAGADTIDAIYDSIIKIDFSGKFLVADFSKRKIIGNNPFQATGLILPREKLYWWASGGQSESKVPIMVISDSLMKLHPKTITVNYNNEFISTYQTQNVIGFIKGREKPDSIIAFSAHYDHLGCMGKQNVFRGANDNASGTAMVLSLAKYFALAENAPKYSMLFMFFAGEEAGLMGSQYFVENPVFPLSKIKLLINLDMVGTGSEGISIVNGEANTPVVDIIKSINNTHSYFTDIQIRGESCNSDHCFFHKAGVPSIFIYTKGKEFEEYHNLKDIPETLPLTKFSELYQMMIDLEKSM